MNIKWLASKSQGKQKLIFKETAPLHQVMDRAYRDLKSANGYPLKQVETKREALKGVLVPLTAEWNVRLLRSAGEI